MDAVSRGVPDGAGDAANRSSRQSRHPEKVREIFDKNREASRQAIAEASDEQLMKNWSLLRGWADHHDNASGCGTEDALHQSYHYHRAQLGV